MYFEFSRATSAAAAARREQRKKQLHQQESTVSTPNEQSPPSSGIVQTGTGESDASLSPALSSHRHPHHNYPHSQQHHNDHQQHHHYQQQHQKQQQQHHHSPSPQIVVTRSGRDTKLVESQSEHEERTALENLKKVGSYRSIL